MKEPRLNGVGRGTRSSGARLEYQTQVERFTTNEPTMLEKTKRLAVGFPWTNDSGLPNAILQGSTIFFFRSPDGRRIRNL